MTLIINQPFLNPEAELINPDSFQDNFATAYATLIMGELDVEIERMAIQQAILREAFRDLESLEGVDEIMDSLDYNLKP